ncbi:hypothetical protein E2C01_067907 [Portunus trituberculatus]|uniref:Uncharacterized protein n=1 Tax=Portunus trituberculatus TaxID=210409 RepID=A0A5B7HUB2_PORTR|nr:hypothetical protein [Portunus trituberculatus]
MTEVMTMSAPAGVNLSTYTYTSAPRIVQNSRKNSNRASNQRKLSLVYLGQCYGSTREGASVIPVK